MLVSFIDNTASILTRRRRFSRSVQDVYYLPVLVSDGGNPSLSSSSTLTIRVCACERDGRVRTCHAEAFLSSAGLSTGALIAILLCVVILLGKFLLVHLCVKEATVDAIKREKGGGERTETEKIEELNFLWVHFQKSRIF